MVSVSRRAPCCPPALRLEVLLLLRGLGLCLNHLLLWVRDVVFPHVLHQVRLLQREGARQRRERRSKEPKPIGRDTATQGTAPIGSTEAAPWEADHLCTLTEV